MQKVKTIGLTGGIGSGKTLVAKVFSILDAPVYYSDDESKKLLNTSQELKNSLKETFGKDIYQTDGTIRKEKFADIIFNDEAKLQQANQIIWPHVSRHFQEWAAQQTADFVLQESALLYESGAYKNHWANIVVDAPAELRIKRVTERDNSTPEQVIKRMKKQMPQKEKNNLADFIVINDGEKLILPQILELRKKILNIQAKKFLQND
jgi:dephospho-CoA kinase